MKDSDIINQVRGLLVAALPAGTTIRTPDGGPDEKDLPEVIIHWSRDRVDDHGHDTFSHFTYDVNGKPVAAVHHRYYEMSIRLEITSLDELQVADFGDAIEDAFFPFEGDSAAFDPATYQWYVGDISPRNNPVVEPGWFEATQAISFRFKKALTDTNITTLDTIQHNITPT